MVWGEVLGLNIGSYNERHALLTTHFTRLPLVEPEYTRLLSSIIPIAAFLSFGCNMQPHTSLSYTTAHA